MPFKKSGRKKEDKTYVYRGREKLTIGRRRKKLLKKEEEYDKPITRAQAKRNALIWKYVTGEEDEPKIDKKKLKKKTTNRTYRRRLYY